MLLGLLNFLSLEECVHLNYGYYLLIKDNNYFIDPL